MTDVSAVHPISKSRKFSHALIPFEDAPMRQVHIKAIAGGMGGQFTDGYIIGVIGIALSLATSQLHLTNFWIGLIAAGSLAGILCGSLMAGSLVDRIGRKVIYSATILVFAIAAVLQYFSASAEQLFALRLLSGVAIGADYAVSLSLVSELAPRRHRGRIMSAVMVAWVAGFVTAYVVGVYLQQFGPQAWRWALASSLLPAVVTLVARFGTPESPLWLLAKGKRDEAFRVIERYFGRDIALPVVGAAVRSSSWSGLFSREWRRNTIIGGAFYFCQVIPFFALGTFMPKVLAAIQVENPNAGGVAYNIFLLVGVLLGVWVVDKISRRAFLMGSFYFCAAALLALTLWNGITPMAAIVLFSAFGVVMSASTVLEFVYLPELFPTELRASGIGFSVAISRIGGAGGTFLLPTLMAEYGIHVTLGSCVIALLMGGLICQLWAPEPEKTLARAPH
ncbi:MFS transporter [Burkholderia oklahomensis]|uniref:MFS transporter n=1 Tax=Burkholderia oklahomensis TaxID=342113 RepID=UPI00264E9B4C|nr:MFS transporter [Burkholderia oklahomensis]MDN7676437.1 MFS transporter [Burkholderia oklahomensis]